VFTRKDQNNNANNINSEDSFKPNANKTKNISSPPVKGNMRSDGKIYNEHNHPHYINNDNNIVP